MRLSRSYPDRSPSRASTASTAASVVVSVRVAGAETDAVVIVRSVLVRTGLYKHGHDVTLRLVDGLDDVARVLAVDLERQRPVTANDDAVEVACGERLALPEAPAAHAVDDETRKIARAHGHGREVREAVVEA